MFADTRPLAPPLPPAALDVTGKRVYSSRYRLRM